MWSGNWSHTVVFCQLVVQCGLVTVVSHSGLLSAHGPVWRAVYLFPRGQVLSDSQTCPHDGMWQALSEER